MRRLVYLSNVTRKPPPWFLVAVLAAIGMMVAVPYLPQIALGGPLCPLVCSLLMAFAAQPIRGVLRQAEQLADELERERAILEALTDNVPVGLSLVDRDMKFTFVNRQFTGMHGGNPEQIIGRTIEEVEPEHLAEPTETAVRKVFDTGEPVLWNAYSTTFDGITKYANVAYVPVRTHDQELIGVGVVVVDITDQVKARQELELRTALLTTLMESVPVGLGFHDRETRHIFANRVLSDMNRMLAEAHDQSLVSPVGKTVWEALPEESASAAAESISKVYDTGEPVVHPDIVVNVDGEERHISVQHTPVRSSDGTIIGVGVVMIDTTEQVRAHKSLEKLYEHEHYIAETLQTALLSTVPQTLDGFGFETVYRAALEEARVGGDFYDVFRINQSNLGIVIGDVSGKGLRAAAEVAAAKNNIRGRAYENPDPSVVMQQVNSTLIREMDPEGFVTGFLGVLNCVEQTLIYTNCGHSPALLWHELERDAELLQPTGPLIGTLPNPMFDKRVVHLHPGDEILLATDGLFEVRVDGEYLGEEGLRAVYADQMRSGHRSAHELLDKVTELCKAELHDDIAILRVCVPKD